VRALDSQTLSTSATCFQSDGDGRRAGLKICSVHSARTYLGRGGFAHVKLLEERVGREAATRWAQAAKVACWVARAPATLASEARVTGHLARSHGA
jgi:hypothetical protein